MGKEIEKERIDKMINFELTNNELKLFNYHPYSI